MKKTTFQEPACQDHGRLVLDLARGRIDDDRVASAERARHDCPVCRAWWQDSLCGEPAAAVDSAVAEAFSGFKAARRNYPRRWIAAAAILFGLVLGLSTVQQRLGDPPSTDPQAEVILAEDFESGRPRWTMTKEPADTAPKASADTLFASSFESGNLSQWSPEG